MVRVRLAPSPTGSPHIGTAWQALFDFVFARKQSGAFILRIEDTDRARYIPQSEGEIIETLKWLGLDYDEGPYRQSERLDIYKKHAGELLEKGLAYKEEGAIKFKTKKEGVTSWHDLIGKNIAFANSTQEDFVIIKSDGFPTYNFANVVDDHLMQISHVIRGNEFISSTPKHIMLYKAFNWEPPQFAHLPVLVGADRAKLSKRHGAKSALDFKKDGYLKEALINFLALLGWSHPDGKEIFSISEMTQVFDFKDFHPSSAFFDTTKLEWLNGEYIRKTQNSKLKTQILEYLRDLAGGVMPDHPTEDEVEKIVPFVKERIKKLSDFIPLTDFLWEKPEYDRSVFEQLKIKSEKLKISLKEIIEKLEEMEKPWKKEIFEETFKKLAEKLEISNTDIFQIIRVSVSGQLVTPPLFESIEILGEDKTLKRVRYIVENYDHIQNLSEKI